MTKSLEQHGLQVRPFQTGECTDRRWKDPRILIVEQGSNALDRHLGGQRAERLGESGPHDPVAIRLHAGERQQKCVRIDLRGGAQRARPHRRPVVGQQILNRRERLFRVKRAQRRHRLQTEVRRGVLAGEHVQQRRHRVRFANLAERSNRRNCQRFVATFTLQQRDQQRRR